MAYNVYSLPDCRTVLYHPDVGTANLHQCGHGILAKRHEVYEAAKKQHPERWNGRDTRDWSIDDVVYLNPDRQVEYTDVAVDNSSKQAS